MKKIIVLGWLALHESILFKTISQQYDLSIFYDKKESEKNINPAFQPEPLKFQNPFIEREIPFFYESEPSKFFSKPKNNFKK